MWWPAVAQTKSPPFSAMMSAIALAFSRRSASPVRITAPVSIDVRVDAGGGIGVVDDVAELDLVDVLLAAIGRERDAGLEQGFARHHEIAARQILAEPAQMDAREDHLGAGGADVDADAGERHMVLDPDRIFLERAVLGEIVVMVGIAVMRMLEVDAIDMVVEGMALRLGIVGWRHRGLRRQVGLA